MNKYTIKQEDGLYVAYRIKDGAKLAYVASDSPKDRERLADAVNKHGWSEVNEQAI